jgi:DNA invertase Pin-like site-specific DNA recombinase
MKAILYARFSPRPNASECESCESQIADLRAYCLAHGHEIIGEFQDKALSGGDDWTDRPGMLDATAACKKGMVFLVRAYDRLFRDTDKALAFRAMLEAKGVEVRSITEEGANGNSMNAKLIRFIFLWIAEYQREIIRARTRVKMREHQANGRRMSHKTPYGTMVDPRNHKRLVPCPEEQTIIATIRDLCGMGCGLREIARALEDTGTPRRGKEKWTHNLVKAVLARADHP